MTQVATVKTVESKMVVVINGEIQTTLCHDLDDIKTLLNEFADDNDCDASHMESATIGIFNIIGEPLESSIHFDLTCEYESPNLGKVEETHEEDTITIKSGRFRGQSFHDEEELRDFLTEKLMSKQLDEEDITHLTIQRIREETLSFDDVSMGAPSVDIKWNEEGGSTFLFDYGTKYIKSTELNRYLEEKIDEWKANHTVKVEPAVKVEPQHMSFEALNAEIEALEERHMALYHERRRRQAEIEEKHMG